MNAQKSYRRVLSEVEALKQTVEIINHHILNIMKYAYIEQLKDRPHSPINQKL
jgi:hypothetical protein